MQIKKLRDKLKKAKSSWQYVWDLIDNILKEEVDFHVKELLFRYQVELDSNFRKMDNVETRLADEKLKLSEDDFNSIDQLLSWVTIDHMAKALFIDKILKEK